MRPSDHLCAKVTGCAAGGAHVRLSGELDLQSAPSVGELLGSLVGDHVELDLSGLTFIDARGLSCLITAAAIQRQAGRPFRLLGSRPSVRRVFELVGLAGMLSEDSPAPCGAHPVVRRGPGPDAHPAVPVPGEAHPRFPTACFAGTGTRAPAVPWWRPPVVAPAV